MLELLPICANLAPALLPEVSEPAVETIHVDLSQATFLPPQRIWSRDDFIRFFEIIPDALWTVNVFASQEGGRHCALGHCGQGSYFSATNMSRQLSALFAARGEHVPIVNDTVAGVSSFTHFPHYFPGATPKARILAALRSFPA